VAERGTVLVVDDDEAIRSMVRLALEDEGYGVLAAADAGARRSNCSGRTRRGWSCSTSGRR
jgi:DNA-binding response OmpR family regulator